MRSIALATLRSLRHLALLAALALVASLLASPPATAATPAPAWNITAFSLPTNFASGNNSGSDTYVVIATNIGGASTDGTPIMLTDRLPTGLTVDPSGPSGHDEQGNILSCSAGPPVTCTDPITLDPGKTVWMLIPVDVASDAPAKVTDAASVSGGGAAAVSTSTSTTISATPAAFGLQHVDGQLVGPDGQPATQAGSHPYEIRTEFTFTSKINANGDQQPSGNLKDIRVKLPPGLIGNPNATPRCSQADFQNKQCPNSAAVGQTYLYFTDGAAVNGGSVIGEDREPIYNLVPPPGAPAQFGFFALQASPIRLTASVRTGGDYGLTVSLADASEAEPLVGTELTFWGVPADPSHDAQRGQCVIAGAGTCPTDAPLKPFLTLPSACSGPLTTTATADSWQKPPTFVTKSFKSHDSSGKPVGIDGCNQLDFSPTLTVGPDTTAADSPSGLNVDLHLPQPDNPTALAEADLKDATVTLPQGVSVSPSSANGLGACSEAQIALHNAKEPRCPNASKIGSVEVDTLLLPDPLTGGIYLAQQGKNRFRSLLAIYVAAQADGVLIKLAGHVAAGSTTGQLQTTFSNNPQLPFTDFKLSFFGGPRAALATPDSCGTYTTTSSLTPYSGTGAATPSDSFAISKRCVSGFKPTFLAGSQNAQAGAFTPFAVSFSRGDRDQYLSGVSLTLPEGVLAKLAGVQECTSAELAHAAASSGAQEKGHPSCPAGSQVGRSETGAGPGPDSIFLPGKVYLTGPYKGAPFGLAVIVPALAGPFDLGTVVVRAALYIDPYTARVKVVSDPLPQILKGIPLRLRRVDVVLNRKQFTLNPTNCNAMKVAGTLTSTNGTTAPVQSRFRVAGCAGLPFSPNLVIGLSGPGQTRSGDHPTLTATLTQRAHQANLHLAKVTLPLSLALDPNNTKHVCPYAVAKKVTTGPVPCPKASLIGSATAVTPLLSKPLSGNVYLVQGIKIVHGHRIHTLPTLLVALRGQLAIDLKANTAVNKKSQLVNVFPAIPDAPVSHFTLTINGGPKGILVITGSHLNICKRPQVAIASLGGQNGKQKSTRIKVATPCTSNP